MSDSVTRVFRIGATELADPCPDKSLDEAVRLLSRNFPQMRSFRLYEEDGEIEGQQVVYTVRTPPAKSNG